MSDWANDLADAIHEAGWMDVLEYDIDRNKVAALLRERVGALRDIVTGNLKTLCACTGSGVDPVKRCGYCKALAALEGREES